MRFLKKLAIALIVICLIAVFVFSRYAVYADEKYKRGIDVSEHQGDIDWTKLSNDEISYVFIRASYGNNVDSCFMQNYEGAKSMQIPIGVYHYLYATTKEEAIEEANYLLSTINGLDFDLPIFLDIEDDSLMHLSRSELTTIVLAFLDVIENAGYDVGYYTNYLTLITKLNYSNLKSYPLWIASYSNMIVDFYQADYWQYTNKGTLEGINHDVDFNYALK